MVELARLLREHEPAAGPSYYETALALRPNSGELVRELADFLIGRDDLIAADFWLSRSPAPEAQEARDTLKGPMRKRAKLHMRIARSHELEGQLDEALRHFSMVLGLAPTKRAWRVEIAEFLLGAGRHAAAEACLEELSGDPQADQLRQIACELRTRVGHRRSKTYLRLLCRSAIAHLVAGRAGLAEPTLRELTLLDPHLHDAWVHLRSARLLLGKTGEAQQLRTQWASAAPSSNGPIIEAVFSRKVSARGLLFDPRDRFPLFAKEQALRQVGSAAELKAASDAYLILDPGGQRVEADPFLRMRGEEPPPRITYTTGQTFMLALDNAMVVGRGAVITQRGEIIADQFLPARVAKYTASVVDGAVVFGPLLGKDPLPTGYAKRPVFLCMGPSDKSFGDWIMEYVPRLALAKAAELDCEVLVHKHLPPNFIDMLKSLGVRPDRIVVQNDGQAVLYRRLYAPSWPAGIREQPMADWLGVFRDMVRPSSSSAGPLLYLSRKHLSNRPLLNEEEICDLFVRRGFQEVNPDTLSLSETLELFANPACIAGPWGSAFENVVFSRRPPIAVALIPRYDAQYMHNVGIFMHAAQVNFGYVVGQTAGPGTPNHAPWTLALDDAKRALDQALELTVQMHGAQLEAVRRTGA